MAVALSSGLILAIGSQSVKEAWVSAFVSAMTTTRRVKILRAGVVYRTADLTGAWVTDPSGITSPGIVSNVTGSSSVNLADGATWTVAIEGGPSYGYTATLVIGTDVTCNLSGTSQAFGFGPDFRLDAPASLMSTGTVLTLTDRSAGSATGYTFSRQFDFQDGQIVTDPRPVVNGFDVTWQADVKRRYPSGACQSAIVSWSANTSLNTAHAIAFKEGTSNNTPISTATILASYGLDQNIQLNSGAQSASAATMIGANKYWRWLSGPVITELIVEDHATKTYDIGAEATKVFRPIFHIQCLGATQKTRARFIGEDCDTAKWGDCTYSLELRNGTTSLYTQTSRTHRAGQRWAKGWYAGTGGALRVFDEVWNRDQLARANVTGRVDDSITLSSTRRSTVAGIWSSATKTIGGNGMWAKDTTVSATRYDIGLHPAWDLMALTDGKYDFWQMARDNADLAGAWPVNYREGSSTRNGNPRYFDSVNTVAALGYPATKNSRPNFNTVGASIVSYDDMTTANTLGGTDGWNMDSDGAHRPSPWYLHAMLTGEWWYHEQVQMWASRATFERNPGVGFDVGSSPDTEKTVAKSAQQTRAQAWRIRDFAQAARAATDGVVRVYRERSLTEGAESLLGAYNDATSVGSSHRQWWQQNRLNPGNTEAVLGYDSLVAPYGPISGYPSSAQCAPFQYAYMTIASAFAKKTCGSVAITSELADWGTRLFVGLVNASTGAGGYPNTSGYIAYNIVQQTDTSFSSFPAAWTTVHSLQAVNGPGLSATDGYGRAAHVGCSYGDYATLAIALACDAGVTNARAAWDSHLKPDMWVNMNWSELPQCAFRPYAGV